MTHSFTYTHTHTHTLSRTHKLSEPFQRVRVRVRGWVGLRMSVISQAEEPRAEGVRKCTLARADSSLSRSRAHHLLKHTRHTRYQQSHAHTRGHTQCTPERGGHSFRKLPIFLSSSTRRPFLTQTVPYLPRSTVLSQDNVTTHT